MKQTDLEAMMEGSLRLNRLPAPVPEYPFAQGLRRRWRFDLAYPDQSIGIEVEGGVWRGGRHTRGQGFTNDCEKANAAQIMGWMVLRFTAEQIESNYAADTIRTALLLRGGL